MSTIVSYPTTKPDMCDGVAHPTRQSFTRHSCPVPTQKSRLSTDNMKHSQAEADSGICTTLNDKLRESFSNFSVSRRSSACSSTYTGQETTPSSAYSSAASSCCETDARLKQNCDSTQQQQSKTTMPCFTYNNHSNINANNNNSFRPENTDLVTSNLMSRLKVSSSSKTAIQGATRRSRISSSVSSAKSDHALAEDSRCLVDALNDTIYEKKRLLGKGGFARVYEVVQSPRTGCDVVPRKRVVCAAKVIEKSRLVRPQQREKVEVEVELLQSARGHPNVVEYYHSFEDDSSICILLELCSKKSLAQYLRKKQYLVEQEVSGITKQIVQGLEHLHGKGILHRDLKLGNILLTEDMTVKIGDFGLATKVEAGKKKTICGTPNFIAPEVLQRQGHGPEADIWALGCLLYTLLVGKPPFETACLRDTYRCILKNSYRLPATVSPEAADLVQWMLRHKPKSRPTIDEIKAHAFFTKHSEHFEISPGIDVPVINIPGLSIAGASDSRLAAAHQESVAAQLSAQKLAEETIMAEIVSKQNVTSCINSATALSHSVENAAGPVPAGSRSPVKRIASRLQKQLSRVPSPRKCVRAATASIKENKKSKVQQKISVTELSATSSQYKKQEATPLSWVSKWVDYSNRYGFGYQLANGRICVLFNDGKHLALLPGGKILEYVSGDSKGAIRFPVDKVPLTMERYANMLRNFTSYMEKNLSRNSDPLAAGKVSDARMLTWFRTDEYVAMYLSDGTLQINFCKDHVKVNISQLHRQSAMWFTVIDEERNVSSFTADDLAALAPKSMPGRLAVMHELFHQMFTDVNCDSHPFCGVCRRNCPPSALATAV